MLERFDCQFTSATVAQCIEGTRAQPFISDQAACLSGYHSLVFTRRGIYQRGWGDSPIFTAYGCDIGRLRRFRNWASDQLMGAPFDFLQAAKHHRVRLLHGHHGMFAVEYLGLQRLTKLPLIVSFYGYDASGFPRSSVGNARRLRNLFKVSKLVVAMSQDMRADLLACGCPSNKIVVHHTGVDLDRFCYRPPRSGTPEPIILCVCDFSPKKGVIDLLFAFRTVLGVFPSTTLRLVGSPIGIAKEEYARTLRVIREEGLGSRVVLTGRIDYSGMMQEYEGADIFVLPSATSPDGNKEGIPAVLMEAQSSGLPVISTYHAGIPEVVVDGESGFLVREHDIDGLAAAMLRILYARERWGPMGRCGRSHMEENFDVREQRHRLELLYDRVLQSSAENEGSTSLKKERYP